MCSFACRSADRVLAGIEELAVDRLADDDGQGRLALNYHDVEGTLRAATASGRCAELFGYDDKYRAFLALHSPADMGRNA
jgi:hypothetical protein